MDEKETNIILKYKRACDSWLCSDCDTENAMSLSRCTVCGSTKSLSDTILKQWTEAGDRTVTPPPQKTTTFATTSVFKDTEKDLYVPKAKSNKNKIIWGVIIAIIVIIINLITAAS